MILSKVWLLDRRGGGRGGDRGEEGCNQNIFLMTTIQTSVSMLQAELEKSGSLGTRFLVHFRPKFGK